MIILFVIIGGSLIFFLLLGLFELMAMIERCIPNRRIKIKAVGAVSLETEEATEAKVLSPEEKEEQAKAKHAKHKKMVEEADLDDDTKRMAKKHAERNYGKKLKDMIDES